MCFSTQDVMYWKNIELKAHEIYEFVLTNRKIKHKEQEKNMIRSLHSLFFQSSQDRLCKTLLPVSLKKDKSSSSSFVRDSSIHYRYEQEVLRERFHLGQEEE